MDGLCRRWWCSYWRENDVHVCHLLRCTSFWRHHTLGVQLISARWQSQPTNYSSNHIGREYYSGQARRRLVAQWPRLRGGNGVGHNYRLRFEYPSSLRCVIRLKWNTSSELCFYLCCNTHRMLGLILAIIHRCGKHIAAKPNSIFELYEYLEM